MGAAAHHPMRGCTAALLLAVLAHGTAGWLVLRETATAEAMPAGRAAAIAMLLVAPQSSARPAVRAEAPRRDSVAKSQHVEREATSASKAAPLAAAAEVFKSPRELERAALPRSAPDISMLAGLPWSGLPTRLRLFVDAAGTVVDVAVLQTSEDEEVVERVRRMFLSTAFVAGRAEGMDVASYKDVELTLGPR